MRLHDDDNNIECCNHCPVADAGTCDYGRSSNHYQTGNYLAQDYYDIVPARLLLLGSWGATAWSTFM